MIKKIIIDWQLLRAKFEYILVAIFTIYVIFCLQVFTRNCRRGIVKLRRPQSEIQYDPYKRATDSQHYITVVQFKIQVFVGGEEFTARTRRRGWIGTNRKLEAGFETDYKKKERYDCVRSNSQLKMRYYWV